MAGSSYCTRSDVLAILSQYSEARLTTDPNRAVQLSMQDGNGNVVQVKGDGHTVAFDTPFIGGSIIKAFVNGDETPAALNSGAGTGGGYQITFSSAPADRAVLTG